MSGLLLTVFEDTGVVGLGGGRREEVLFRTEVVDNEYVSLRFVECVDLVTKI